MIKWKPLKGTSGQINAKKRGGYLYILANKRRTVLYTGVATSLKKRTMERQAKKDVNSFAARFNCDVLIYYQSFHSMEDAIEEEARIKGLSRSEKLKLINTMNPSLKDLFPDLVKS